MNVAHLGPGRPPDKGASPPFDSSREASHHAQTTARVRGPAEPDQRNRHERRDRSAAAAAEGDRGARARAARAIAQAPQREVTARPLLSSFPTTAVLLQGNYAAPRALLAARANEAQTREACPRPP